MNLLFNRSYSPLRNRFIDGKDRFEDDFRRLDDLNRSAIPIGTTPVRPGTDRGMHLGTIIQLTGTDVPPVAASRIPPPVGQIVGDTGTAPQLYYRENEEYGGYYQGNNLTYPRIAEESVESPKRLSLDDR